MYSEVHAWRSVSHHVSSCQLSVFSDQKMRWIQSQQEPNFCPWTRKKRTLLLFENCLRVREIIILLSFFGGSLIRSDFVNKLNALTSSSNSDDLLTTTGESCESSLVSIAFLLSLKLSRAATSRSLLRWIRRFGGGASADALLEECFLEPVFSLILSMLIDLNFRCVTGVSANSSSSDVSSYLWLLLSF